MRYRTTIYVDFFTDSKQEAEAMALEAVLSINNACLGDTVEMPHGSVLSFDKEESDIPLVSKGDGS